MEKWWSINLAQVGSIVRSCLAACLDSCGVTWDMVLYTVQHDRLHISEPYCATLIVCAAFCIMPTRLVVPIIFVLTLCVVKSKHQSVYIHEFLVSYTTKTALLF